MKQFFLIIILSAIIKISYAQSSTRFLDTLASDYMEAYGKWDFDKMKTFYSDTIHFEDPTGSEQFGQHYFIDGKENVYHFFKDMFKGSFKDNKPRYVNFIIDKKIITESYAIFSSTFECIIPTNWYKENSNESILISIPFVTILRFRNGKIISHSDFGDYTTYIKQIRAQLEH